MSGPARVFISYSSKDTDLVDALKADLAAAGVAVWLDHEQLTPDTLDWQNAVWRGILQATHVLYVASPTAARSQYVIHEITIARGEGKPVLPFWIRGEKWYECTPMGWILAQYTDGRGASYRPGLAKLVATLGATGARHPLPDVPARLASLGFRGVNPSGTPAIIPPLVSVAAGPFLMGSADSDTEAYDNEKPQHRVDLPAFQIGKYPVTVAEYALAVRAGAVREPPSWKPSEILVNAGWPDRETTWQTQQQHPDHPVVCVSWQDAQAYVAWLREATGEAGWGLPSEAQWEKAARWDAAPGVSRLYPWGDSFDKNRCNTWESGIKTTTPVGNYPAIDPQRSGASPYGAEDMAGNVGEWASSVYKPCPYTQNDGREDRKYTDNRTLRGGSWVNDAGGARAAVRSNDRPDVVSYDIGFRLALVGRSAGS